MPGLAHYKIETLIIPFADLIWHFSYQPESFLKSKYYIICGKIHIFAIA